MTRRDPADVAVLSRLAGALQTWTPRGVSIELASEDRLGLREQLARHLVAELELGDDVELAAAFVAASCSPVGDGDVDLAGDVDPDELLAREVADAERAIADEGPRAERDAALLTLETDDSLP